MHHLVCCCWCPRSYIYCSCTSQLSFNVYPHIYVISYRCNLGGGGRSASTSPIFFLPANSFFFFGYWIEGEQLQKKMGYSVGKVVHILRTGFSEYTQLFLTWLIHKLKFLVHMVNFVPPSVNSQVTLMCLLLPWYSTHQYSGKWMADIQETLTRKRTFCHCTALLTIDDSVAPLQPIIPPAQWSVQQMKYSV